MYVGWFGSYFSVLGDLNGITQQFRETIRQIGES